VWTAEAIREMLTASDSAVERACVAIYKRQTEVEQNADATINKNWVGFNAADAKRLSRAAKWVMSGHRLSDHFLADARTRCLKYAKQLTEIANAKKVSPKVTMASMRNGECNKTLTERAAERILRGVSIADALGEVMP
jgi:hypothetical protein